MSFGFRLGMTLNLLLGSALFASCAPIAPSVEKGQLGLKNRNAAVEASAIVTGSPEGKTVPADRALVVRDKSGNWVFAGPDDYRSISKKSELTTVTLDNPGLRDQLISFRDERKVFLQIDLNKFRNPSAETLEAAVYFEISTKGLTLTPAMVRKLDFKWEYKPKRGARGVSEADWFVKMGEVPQDVAQPFLNNLISITAATREKK